MSVTINLVNETGKEDSSVYVVFWADQDSDVNSPDVTNKTVYALSDLPGSTGDRNITMNAFSSGRMYFSLDKKLDTSGLRPDGNNINDDAYHKRYDKIELTYPGTVNLTMVDFFGIPVSLRTMDSSGGTLHLCQNYTNTSELVDALAAQANSASSVTINDDAGSFMRVMSTLKRPTDYTSMQDYINAVKGTSMNVNGTYLSTGGNKAYAYTATVNNDGSISMTMSGEKDITLPASTLANTIYTNMAAYTVGSDTNKHTGDNDFYSAVVRDVLAGFAAGYVSSTPADNDTSKWWTKQPYTSKYYNKYAKVVWDNADAYGFPFNERIKAKTILLPADDNNDVSTIQLTFLSDTRLSAPQVTKTTTTSDSITLEWGAVSGATGYTAKVGTDGTPVTISGTSHTFSGLNSGTAYTIYLAATSASGSSCNRPASATTTGTVQPHTGSFPFNLTLFFNGSQSGTAYSINGQDFTVKTGDVPAQLVQLSGNLNTMNDYPFTFGESFKSTLHVRLDGSGITSNASDFVLDNNQAAAVPTPPNQCALSIQPNG